MDHPGGVQSCVYSLIRGLNRRGIIPDILWDIEPDWSQLTGLDLKAGFQAIHFPFPTRWITRFPNTLRYLLWTANGISGDYLHYQYDYFYLFYNGFFLSADIPHLRYLSGPPLIPELKNSSSGLRGVPYRFLQWFYRHVISKTNPVYEYHKDSLYVINSEFTARLFEHAHGVHLPVIHPPIDFSGREFHPQDWSTRDSLTFFSRFISYKRPEMILQLARLHPELRCVMMGGVPPIRRGYFESLQQRANQMGLRNVVFLANPTNERVRQELSRTRYYIFPAKNEHFGMTTPEAIASGAIPYVHNSGGQVEIVNDPRLRFDDSEFAEKFKSLTALSEETLEDIRVEMYKHVQLYAEDVYITKMLAYMDQSYQYEGQYPIPSNGKVKSNGKTGTRVIQS